MSYLRLIEDKIQSFAESMSSTLNVEITVVDNNLMRIAGTGDFYYRINMTSPSNSWFARVLKTGIEVMNLNKGSNSVCAKCVDLNICKERITFVSPIKDGEDIIGVVCFASFNDVQDQIIISKKDEYMTMLRHFAKNIETEISNIKMVNALNIEKAEINAVIDSISKGIIILNSEKKITHINMKAIKTLGINISSIKIINSKISDIIGNIKLEETNEKELSGRWTVGEATLNVLYKISYILLENNDISTLISFESINEIFNIALKFQSDNIITFENIIRHSYVMEDIISKAKIAARSDSTVFLKGESGTGKELFARSIHNASMRKNNPFIVINCATLPENLIESELFGYEKGSFTGASPKGKIGKFEQANNGTLFLDEIADLPLHLQSKLLRVLQEKSIEKIGSTDQIDVNVRIISATHRNLEDMVKRNEFREDLYYRLNVIPLHIPALRERENDVILITEYIINKLCKKFNKTEKHISKDVEEFFLTCPWHGNVRELENVLEYAINFSTEDEIGIEDLPDYFLNSDRDKKFPREDVEFEIQDLMNIKSLEKATREYEKRILKNLLEMYDGNKDSKKIIAKKLNISVTTLYRKLNDYYLND